MITKKKTDNLSKIAMQNRKDILNLLGFQVIENTVFTGKSGKISYGKYEYFRVDSCGNRVSRYENDVDYDGQPCENPLWHLAKPVERMSVNFVGMVPCAYAVLSYRKRQDVVPDTKILHTATDLRVFTKTLLAKARKFDWEKRADFCELIVGIKAKVYANRIDKDRPVSDVVHTMISYPDASYSQAWTRCFQGQGLSVLTGRPLKYIICVEKIRKAAKLFIRASRRLKS